MNTDKCRIRDKIVNCESQTPLPQLKTALQENNIQAFLITIRAAHS